MSNSISYSRPKWDLWMVAALVCVAVVLGIYPADRTVWCVEMVWAVGLWAILLLTRRKFRFSTPAYLCFFVWTVLQLVGAHYTFEHVPMEWLMKPLGLVRNPYDRIAHFAVGWFAFPLAELFFRKGWAKSAGFAAFFAVMSTVAMAGIWELVEWWYAVVDGGEATYGTRRRTSSATPSARSAPRGSSSGAIEEILFIGRPRFMVLQS